MRLVWIVGFILSLAYTHLALAANPELDWKTFETDHFLIHYPTTLGHLVNEVATESERAHELLVPYMEWTPVKKTQVVMVDDFDSPNGSATPIPNNTMMLIMQPPISGSLTDYDSWLRLLIVHEYTHILHLDKALDWPKNLRNLFGRFLLLFPNALHPNWFQEGFATFKETDDAQGLGRGQSDTYQMMMRQEVLTGLKSMGKINTVLSREWPVNHAYLYGVYYMRFIRDTYGEDALKTMIKDYSDNLVPFRVDSNPEGATGRTLTQLWPQFEQYLQAEFEPQIERIQQQPLTHTTQLVKAGFNYSSPRIDSQNTIWFTGRDGYNGSALYHYNQGEALRVMDLNSGGDMDINDEDEIVISQLEYCDNRYLYYDLYKISQDELNQENPKLQRLTQCGRYHHVRWYQGDLIALQYSGAKAKLVRLNGQGEHKAIIWEGQSGDIMGEFDVNEAGDLVAVIKFAKQSWNLFTLNLNQKPSWQPVTQDDAIPSAPHLQGNQLYYVLAAEGQKEAYRLNLANAKQSAGSVNGQRLTNLLTGIEVAIPYSQRQLLMREYTDQGYRISIGFINEDLTELTAPPATSYPEAKEVEGTTSNYTPLPSLAPTWWLPVARSDGTTSELGLLTQGNDAAGFHAYSAILTHESQFNYLLPNINYQYDGRLLVNYLSKLSSVDFGLNEDVETASFERDISLAYMYHDLSIKRRFNPYLAYINSETRYITDDGKTRTILFRGERKKVLKDDWVAAGFIYNTLEADIFQGDYSSGSVWQFNVESASVASNDQSDGEVFTLDGRFNLSFDNHHMLSQRWVLGIGNDEAPDFELGGTFSDAFIAPAITLNKRNYALRGYEEDLAELRNDNMALYAAEYRLPFHWNENSIMKPPIGTLGWSARMFFEVGSVWEEGENPEKGYSSVGGELILDDTLAYYLPLRLRLGVAKGLEEEGTEVGYIQFGSAF